MQLTFTRARVRPILSANCFLKSVLGLGNLPNSCSRIVICSCVNRGRLDVSTSSPVSIGEASCPEVCLFIMGIEPFSDPSEWNAGAALDESESVGFDRLFLLYMASNSMFLECRRLPRWSYRGRKRSCQPLWRLQIVMDFNQLGCNTWV